MARAGTHKEKEEVVMGRRGCRASSRAGILSGWVCTLHGSGTVGKGHDCGATQCDVRRWQSWASSLTVLKLKKWGEKQQKQSGQREKLF